MGRAEAIGHFIAQAALHDLIFGVIAFERPLRRPLRPPKPALHFR
jgi:hypothetical protein